MGFAEKSLAAGIFANKFLHCYPPAQSSDTKHINRDPQLEIVPACMSSRISDRMLIYT